MPLELVLLQSCRQVRDELNAALHSKIFQFNDLDTLLAFLAISTNARHLLRHVDVKLVSGPQGLGTYALSALSELYLQTLTIRCFAIQGSEEDWTKSFQIRLLMKTRGVDKVTFAPVQDSMILYLGTLTASDPLGQKLVTQLQRPAMTLRRDPSRLPIMPAYPRPGVSGCMPRPVYPMRWSVTDFRGFNNFQTFQYTMPDGASVSVCPPSPLFLLLDQLTCSSRTGTGGCSSC
jgi:hypothetical protein